VKNKGPTGKKPVGPKKYIRVAARAESAGRDSNLLVRSHRTYLLADKTLNFDVKVTGIKAAETR